MPSKKSLVRREIEKLFYVYFWHQFTSSSFSIGKLLEGALRLILALIPFSVIIFSGKPYKWHLLGAWITISLIVRRKDLSPKNLQFIREGYADRKGKFSLALMALESKAVGKALSREEKEKIQVASLDMIVSYSRGHRSDTRNTKIFANLLVEAGEDLMVKVRDSHSQSKRLSGAKYPKSSMLAWRAMQERRVQVSGDIYADYPATPSDKPYKSILCIPILQQISGGTKAIGVVSIDSSEPHHFDEHENDLETNLMPYVRLIAITLS